MSRLDRLRTLLAEHHLDAILLHNGENRTYLTGFTGSVLSVVKQDGVEMMWLISVMSSRRP